MLRLLLLAFSAVVLYTIVKTLIRDISSRLKSTDNRREPEELVQDPHCHIYLPKRLAIRKRVAGKDHYFCKEDCLLKYLSGKN